MWWLWILLAVVLLFGGYFFSAFSTFKVLFGRPIKVPKIYTKPLYRHKFSENMPDIKKGQLFYKGKESEAITIEYNNLKLSGMFYENKESNKIIVFVHGFYSYGLYDIGYVGQLHQDLGVSLLIIDQRACAKSEGKYTSLGILERFDVREWLIYLDKRFNGEKDIYLHGVSMGAATSLLVTGLSDLPQSFKGVIADCGYSGTKGVLFYVGKKLFKIRPRFLFWGINTFASTIGGFDFKSIKVSNELKKNHTIPILFIHGVDDNFVPFNMSVKNFKHAAVAEKKLVAFAGAEHCGCYLKDKERYYNEVKNFING